MLQTILVILVVAIGGILQTAFGFGMGPLLMAFLPMFMPFNDAIVIFLILAIMSNVVLTIMYFRYIQWKVLLPILIPTVLLVAGIAFFAVNIEAEIMYLALGFLLIALAVYFFIFTGKVHIKPSILNGSLMGILCGICGGFFALSGPGAALYFLPAIKEKKQYLGTFQVYFLIINVVNLIIRLLRGNFTVENIPILLFGAGALLVGTLLGYLLFRNFSGKWFERGVYILIGLNGIWIVISHFLNIG